MRRIVSLTDGSEEKLRKALGVMRTGHGHTGCPGGMICSCGVHLLLSAQRIMKPSKDANTTQGDPKRPSKVQMQVLTEKY